MAELQTFGPILDKPLVDFFHKLNTIKSGAKFIPLEICTSEKE